MACGLHELSSRPTRQGFEWLAFVLRDTADPAAADLVELADREALGLPSAPLAIDEDWWFIGPLDDSDDGLNPDDVWQIGGAHRLSRDTQIDTSTVGAAGWSRLRTTADGAVDIRPFRYSQHAGAASFSWYF